MSRIRLTAADRERYGGPEWLDWDDGRKLTVAEATALQEHVGAAWEKYGQWLREGGVVAIKWCLWVSLRRAGVEVDWAAFDPDLLGAEITRDPEPEVPVEGKAPRRSTRPRRSAASAKS